MDWDAFIRLQWIQGDTGNSPLNDARERIGSQWGLESDWYSSENNLAVLFNFLSEPEPQYGQDGRHEDGERPELLDELEALPDAGEGEEANEDERATWMETVASNVYWAQFWMTPENRYDPPEYSEPHRMYYRYDRLNEVYEWNSDPLSAPEAWISQQEADALIAAPLTEPSGETQAGTVEAAAFATTEEAQEGAERVTGLVQETLNRTVTALPDEVVAALGSQELENMAIEANKL
jgi:hypothetical protein